ncbi:MAG: transcriptional repressor [Rhodospirillaceae bacterium]|jgi:Fur family transcriptional regulator, zinc uptake regulator|nr:transcriptional repressor [Rhodospirillaceae bacterium]MBT4688583.1 transcriptional repressor [Rhodospirillaceae bacterium]MBT5195059.1 transcriptional repressor [Rhodospirillaceae bacterium]MBT6431425.1 transcriptional repressor [Rhodospirillaceae bacterium]MBT7757791.1 transcriptional repressor [Rhodospirillaceae bacterium]
MTSGQIEDPFASPGHDHAGCIEAALDAAEATCVRRGERLTPLRRRVLELVWAGHSPVGAYDLLALLQDERGRVAPPTVYRALEFLCRQGLVHRLDSLQAFIGCGHPGAHGEGRHAAHFLICRDCGVAVEVRDGQLDGAISHLAGRTGFTIADETIELSGRCAACQS